MIIEGGEGEHIRERKAKEKIWEGEVEKENQIPLKQRSWVRPPEREMNRNIEEEREEIHLVRTHGYTHTQSRISHHFLLLSCNKLLLNKTTQAR